MSKLNPKQEAFCKEYVIDFNGTQAAIRAKYSENTANEIASQHLAKLNIQNRIKELINERNNRLEINADYVLRRLVEIDELDVADILDEKGNIKPITQWSKSWRTSINAIDIIELTKNDDVQSFLKKIKFPDKLKNLELLGKHVDVSAFRDKLELAGKDGGPITVSNEHTVVFKKFNKEDDK